MKARLQIVLFVLIGMMFALKSPAGLIQSLNNTADGIAVDDSRSDWVGLTAFAPDSAGEAGIGPFDVDWNRITIANNSSMETFYIRYALNVGADFDNFPAFYDFFIDADEDRGTGYIGGGSQLPIGADYLIQGANVFSFSGGDQTTFSWNFVTALTADNSFTNLDISMELPATAIGSPSNFHFVLLGDNTLSGNTADYYPDGGDQGGGGDYFRYTTEPFVVEVEFAQIDLTRVFAFSITNSLPDVTYRLDFAPMVAPSNWVSSGFRVDGNGGDLILYDPAGFDTTKFYRVVAEF